MVSGIFRLFVNYLCLVGKINLNCVFFYFVYSVRDLREKDLYRNVILLTEALLYQLCLLF